MDRRMCTQEKPHRGSLLPLREFSCKPDGLCECRGKRQASFCESQKAEEKVEIIREREWRGEANIRVSEMLGTVIPPFYDRWKLGRYLSKTNRTRIKNCSQEIERTKCERRRAHLFAWCWAVHQRDDNN